MIVLWHSIAFENIVLVDEVPFSRYYAIKLFCVKWSLFPRRVTYTETIPLASNACTCTYVRTYTCMYIMYPTYVSSNVHTAADIHTTELDNKSMHDLLIKMCYSYVRTYMVKSSCTMAARGLRGMREWRRYIDHEGGAQVDL